MKNLFLQKVLGFLILALILGAAYSPALFITYAHHDDYHYLNKAEGSKYALMNIVITRPAAAWIQVSFLKILDSIEDLKKHRAVVYFFILISAYSLFLFLQTRVSPPAALLISGLIFLLPPFQVFISYAGNGTYFPSVLFALWAGILCGVKVARLDLKTWILRGGIAGVLLILALNVYRPGAMFFWVVPAILILTSSPERKISKELFLCFGVGFFSLTAYSILLKIMKPYHLSSAATLGLYNPYSVTTNYADKLSWFMSQPFMDASNLWNIFTNSGLSFIVNVLIFFGISAGILQSFRQGTKQKFLFCLLILILPLTFLPNLAAVGSAGWYRCQAALSATVLLMALWSLRTVFEIFKMPVEKLWLRILAVLLLTAMLTSYHNILFYRAVPSHAELACYKLHLKKAFEQNIHRIHVIGAKNQVSDRYDEFGVWSSRYHDDIRHIINVSLDEVFKNTDWRIVRKGFFRSVKSKNKIWLLLRNSQTGEIKSYPLLLTYSAEKTFAPGALTIDIPLHQWLFKHSSQRL